MMNAWTLGWMTCETHRKRDRERLQKELSIFEHQLTTAGNPGLQNLAAAGVPDQAYIPEGGF